MIFKIYFVVGFLQENIRYPEPDLLQVPVLTDFTTKRGKLSAIKLNTDGEIVNQTDSVT